MTIIRLRYGNTNTFLVGGRLLVDTDYAGTLPAEADPVRALAGGASERMNYRPACHRKSLLRRFTGAGGLCFL